jgi:uncharacterized membrane protein YeaQ/YmgE (transglycosylase-associated protein family)
VTIFGGIHRVYIVLSAVWAFGACTERERQESANAAEASLEAAKETTREGAERIAAEARAAGEAVEDSAEAAVAAAEDAARDAREKAAAAGAAVKETAQDAARSAEKTIDEASEAASAAGTELRQSAAETADAARAAAAGERGGIAGLISWLLIGLVIGAVAKLFMPGEDTANVFTTTLLGIGGAILGGVAATLLGLGSFAGISITGLLTAVLGAMALLLAFRGLRSAT